jgi:hypothetical protein
VRSCRSGCAKDKVQTMKSTVVMISAAHGPPYPARHTAPGACHSASLFILVRLITCTQEIFLGAYLGAYSQRELRSTQLNALRSVLQAGSVLGRVLRNALRSVQLSVLYRPLRFGRQQSARGVCPTVFMPLSASAG